MENESSPAASLAGERSPPCALHRRAASLQTCEGCGLFLCATCAESVGKCTRCRSPLPSIPWEERGTGWVTSFLGTLRRLLKPDAFFASMSWSGGLKSPLGFGVLCAFLGALGALLIALLLSIAVGGFTPYAVNASLKDFEAVLRPSELREIRLLTAQIPTVLESIRRLQVLSLLLNPLSTAMAIVVLAALSHPLARWLGGQGSFEATFRVIAYSTSAKILYAVPGFGALLAFVGELILLYFGMRRAHGLSPGRAWFVALWWLPVAFVAALLLVAWLSSMMFGVLFPQ